MKTKVSLNYNYKQVVIHIDIITAQILNLQIDKLRMILSRIFQVVNAQEDYDLFYNMQEKIHHFPDQLQQLTQKAAKKITNKYKFEDETLTSIIQQRQHLLQRQQVLQKLKKQDQSLSPKQKINLKLKLIRTMLGYQNKKQKQKAVYKTINHSENEIKANKGMNLKQFVLSMRKKSQGIDKCFDNQRIQSIEFNKSLQPKNNSIQEYGEISLKYIHSFIPHQTQVDNNQFKRARKINYSVNDSPQRQQLEHSPIIQKAQNINLVKTIEPSMNEASSNKIASVHRPKNSNIDDYTLINSTTPMKIFVNPLGVLYHGKNYNRDLQQRANKFKSQYSIFNNLNQKVIERNDHQKEFLPIIQHYFPVPKNKKSRGSHVSFN